HAGFANIETTRGCPYSCCYCVEPSIKGKVVRVKPPETVTREIEWFMQKGICYFFITDSEFNADHQAAESLCEYWIKTGYASKMKWVAYATPAHFSEKLASSIIGSGNLSLMVDFGHVSNLILSQLGKSYDSRTVEETVNICEVNHLNYRGSLMLGGPGETRETVKEAIDFFKGLTCKVFVVIGIRIFPNTPLAEVVRAAGPLVDNPQVYGKVIDNDDLLEPVFYISQDLGEDIYTYMTHLVGNSEQFYTPFQLKLLTKEMYGPFRGFKPDYTPCAKTESQYITRYSHDELKNRIFDEKQGD
ncbi:MAG: radical SAM protein, partial [Theionarchaea archaeon]|nr:radical SAM protein [Theionarchaea archaeon]